MCDFFASPTKNKKITYFVVCEHTTNFALRYNAHEKRYIYLGMCIVADDVLLFLLEHEKHKNTVIDVQPIYEHECSNVKEDTP